MPAASAISARGTGETAEARGMNKTLAAFERDLVERDRARRRRPYEPAGLPPVPADPMQCRWCGGRLRLLIDGDPQSTFCQNLCAPNDVAPFTVECAECGRSFQTGKHHATICHACETREQATRTNGGPDYRRDRWLERHRKLMNGE